MINNKQFFVVFKNPLKECYYFDLEENWRQHKRYCEFVVIFDSLQTAQELCVKLEKQEK